MNGAQGQMVSPSGSMRRVLGRVLLSLAAFFFFFSSGLVEIIKHDSANISAELDSLPWGVTWHGLAWDRAMLVVSQWKMCPVQCWGMTYKEGSHNAKKKQKDLQLTYSLNYCLIFWRTLGGDVLLLCPVPVNVCCSYLHVDKCSFCHATELQ